MSVLDPAAYVGPYDKRGSDAQDGGQSSYDGAIVATLVDRAKVSQVLPPALQLADRTDGKVLAHPVIHLLGRQNDPCTLASGTLTRVPYAAYNELILLVPFVHHVNGTKLHSFAVRMYLDSELPIKIGNTYYAYAKEHGDFQLMGASTNVLHFDPSEQANVTCFNSEVHLAGPWVSADPAANANLPLGFDAVQAVFEMPIVGFDDLTGECICSYFEWDYTQALVAKAASLHRFATPFRGDMAWEAAWYRGVDDATFKVREVRWRLSLSPAGAQAPAPARPLQPPACLFA